ncbi:meiosis-specific nuclear structural protein 1-like, partial [Plakobranchus ocellatus]
MLPSVPPIGEGHPHSMELLPSEDLDPALEASEQTLLIFVPRELERQMQKRQATQKYISEFKQSREAWKIEEKKKMEEENAKILAFAKKMQEREA